MKWRHWACRCMVLVVASAASGQDGYLRLGSQVAVPTLTFPFFGIETPAARDLDGSGLPDVVFGLAGGTVVHVARDPGAAGGPTITTQPYLNGAGQNAFSLAELTGDAFPDLVEYVPTATSNLRVYPGTGVMSWNLDVSQALEPALPGLPGLLIVPSRHYADLNGDGVDDIVLSSRAAGFAGRLDVFVSSPSGWVAALTVAATILEGHAVTGDFDGDGDLDVAWQQRDLNLSGVVVDVYLGDGAGGFTGPLTATQGLDAPVGVPVIGDLDDDGRDDLVAFVSGFGPPTALVFYGMQTGGVENGVYLTQWSSLSGRSVIADLDGDGITDFGYANVDLVTGRSRLSLLKGRGNRSFPGPRLHQPLDLGPNVSMQMAPADLDLDGDVDYFGFTPVVGPGFPAFAVQRNDAFRGTGCAGTGGTVPSLLVGSATPGNAAFALDLRDALPNAPSFLGVSLADVPGTGCGILIDLSLPNLLVPAGPLGIVATDATGAATVPIPIANDPALLQATVHAQWAVVDPGGAFNPMGLSLAFTPARLLVIW